MSTAKSPFIWKIILQDQQPDQEMNTKLKDKFAKGSKNIKRLSTGFLRFDFVVTWALSTIRTELLFGSNFLEFFIFWKAGPSGSSFDSLWRKIKANVEEKLKNKKLTQVQTSRWPSRPSSSRCTFQWGSCTLESSPKTTTNDKWQQMKAWDA